MNWTAFMAALNIGSAMVMLAMLIGVLLVIYHSWRRK